MDGLLIRLSEGSVFFRRKDEERWGEYRTKRMVLEQYDTVGEADRRGAHS